MHSQCPGAPLQVPRQPTTNAFSCCGDHCCACADQEPTTMPAPNKAVTILITAPPTYANSSPCALRLLRGRTSGRSGATSPCRSRFVHDAVAEFLASAPRTQPASAHMHCRIRVALMACASASAAVTATNPRHSRRRRRSVGPLPLRQSVTPVASAGGRAQAGRPAARSATWRPAPAANRDRPTGFKLGADEGNPLANRCVPRLGGPRKALPCPTRMARC
jgi:hypothetical protein